MIFLLYSIKDIVDIHDVILFYVPLLFKSQGPNIRDRRKKKSSYWPSGPDGRYTTWGPSQYIPSRSLICKNNSAGRMPTSTSIYRAAHSCGHIVHIIIILYWWDPSIKDEEKGHMQLVELSIQRVVFLIVSQDDSSSAVKRVDGRPQQHNDPIQAAVLIVVTRNVQLCAVLYLYIRLNLRPINYKVNS